MTTFWHVWCRALLSNRRASELCLVKHFHYLYSNITAEWSTAFPGHAFLRSLHKPVLIQWLLTNISLCTPDKERLPIKWLQKDFWSPTKPITMGPSSGDTSCCQAVRKMAVSVGEHGDDCFEDETFTFTIFYHSKVSPPRFGPRIAERGFPWERRGRAPETRETL